MTTDETTAKALQEVVDAFRRVAPTCVTNAGLGPAQCKDASLANALRRVADELEKSRATAPSPATPSGPQFKEGDWVQSLGRIGDHGFFVGRIVGLDPTGYPMSVEDEAGQWHTCLCEDELLPIPPKPEKVQEGYHLTGEVLKCDGLHGKSWVAADLPEFVMRFLTVQHGGRPAHPEYFGGRRWIAELAPACPHCKDTHICPHCKEKRNDPR